MIPGQTHNVRRLWSVVLLAAVCGCAREPPPAVQQWLAMGTFASVSVPASLRDRLPAFAAEAQAQLADLEASLSRFVAGSEVSRITASAGRGCVPVSDDTLEVLAEAVRYGALSGGAFDVTVGPLMQLWGFSRGGTPDRAPDADAVKAALETVGFEEIILTNRAAGLGKPGMQLDLGGIAKGYAVDVCYRALTNHAAHNVMVNLGGNIRCGGSPREGRPWRIAVRNPFDAQRPLGTLALSGGMAVASSGNYERFVVIADVRYAHILDPRSGYPVRGMAGVTVVAPTAVAADALSTALFVLGMEEGGALLASTPGCEALFVPDEQPLRVHVTPGFLTYFTPYAEFQDRVHRLRQHPHCRDLGLARRGGKG